MPEKYITLLPVKKYDLQCIKQIFTVEDLDCENISTFSTTPHCTLHPVDFVWIEQVASQ